MEFRIADTFTGSLVQLNGAEQKAVKTTAFDLQTERIKWRIPRASEPASCYDLSRRAPDDRVCPNGGKMTDTLLQRISIDPQVCGGKPCIKGTRIWVSLILDFLAEGMSEGELLAEYPQLVHEDVLAAIAYGAEAARVRFVPVPAA